MARYIKSDEQMPIRFVKVQGEDYVRFQDVIQWLKNQQKRLNGLGEKELLQIVIRELIAANNGLK